MQLRPDDTSGTDPSPGTDPDRGAVAVEFALLLPVLMAILLGMVQYGYGLYQYQGFTAAVNQTALLAASGIDDCAWLLDSLAEATRRNGLPVDADHPVDLTIAFTYQNGTPAPGPQRYGWADLNATYTGPVDLNVPLVPFPDSFTARDRVLVLDVKATTLGGCVVAP